MSDSNGNLSSVTDAENRKTSYKNTYQSQIEEITDARQKLTKLEYGTASCPSCANGTDKLTAVRDANHVANNQPGTVYTYDKAGRVETETDPVGKKLRYTYFESGLVKERIDATNPDAEKILIRYRYNHRGQLTDKIYSDNTSVHFEYDSNGRLKNAGNQTGVVTTYRYTFTYHDNGRLKSVTDSLGKTVSYDEYDGNGRRKKVTYLPGTPDQRVVSYDYEGDNVRHIYSPAGTFVFDYDARGRRSKLTFPNWTQADYGYDDLDRLLSLNHSVTGGSTLSSNGYPEYDQVGNIKTRTGTYPGSYIYNEIYRLMEASGPAGQEKYDYDDVGNRTKGPGPKDTRYSYDTANRITMGRLFRHDYDNAGNQLTRTVPASGNGWTYTWNDENQLVKAEQVKRVERRTVTFTYDPFGRRIGKKQVAVQGGQTKTTTWSYFYDQEDIVSETVNDGTTTTTARYTHGPDADEPLALERGGQAYFYHADHLGSVTAISDASGVVVQRYSYDSFGNVTPSTAFANSYSYTGREWDKETGLYYYRARYYDPMEGRFISKDPISFAGGDVNLYGYVSQNPINRVDPSGLKKKGLLIPIRKWLKKNLTQEGIVDEIVDVVSDIVNIPFTWPAIITWDFHEPKELGFPQGQDEYMIWTYKKCQDK